MEIDVLFLLRGRPGLGHVTPGYAIAKELESEGMSVFLMSYANGADFLRANCKPNQFIDIGDIQEVKGRVPWKDLFGITIDVLPVIARINPKVIVIDGEYDAFFLVNNVKVVMLTTAPYTDMSFDKYKKYRDYLAEVFHKPDLVIVHGISKPELMSKNSVYVGPLTSVAKGNIATENLVVISIGVSPSEQMKSCATNLKLVAMGLGFDVKIVGKGMLEAVFVDNIMEEFGKAKLIVAQGGISTITEALVIGKPLIVMCDDDAEKTNNAKYAEKIGRAITMDCEEMNIEKIKSVVQKALSLNVTPLPVDGMATTIARIRSLLESTTSQNSSRLTQKS